MGWKYYASGSTAYDTLKSQSLDTFLNNPKSFYGAEVTFSPLYGKLSVLGKAIIYYDLYFMLGAGLTDTDSGKYFTPTFGIGQQIYIAKWLAFFVDFRLLTFKEDIYAPKTSTVALSRTNWSNTVTTGFSFLLGPSTK